jgi:hypothetical protein
MNFAADIWKDSIEVKVPIKIQVTFLPRDLSFLGLTIPNGRKNFEGAPMEEVWYPTSLANTLAGSELNPGEEDMLIIIDATTNWYYGTDGNPPQGTHDFVTIFLHEICHGLGFGSVSSLSDGQGFFGGEFVNAQIRPLVPFPVPDLELKPSIYDVFLENTDGESLLQFTNPSITLANEFQSGAIFWTGPLARMSNNNTDPKIFAPTLFDEGSSISHLDEQTFNGTPNALMTPSIGQQEVLHQPGALTLAILEDLGWELKEREM